MNALLGILQYRFREENFPLAICHSLSKKSAVKSERQQDQYYGCAETGAEADAECIGVGSFTVAAAPGSSRSFR
jgi:hypothetical protein